MKHHLFSRLIFIVFTSLPLFVSAAGEVVSVDAQSSAVVAADQSIDLNSADAQALQQALNGVGAVKAKAIVDYRQEHGPFASVDELLEVKGIGAAILEKNRNKLRVH